MTVRYEITGSVANGDYLSPAMDAGFGQCELSSIRFFNAGGVQVVPTAGSITFSGTAATITTSNISLNGGVTQQAMDMRQKTRYVTKLIKL